jgi:uncharacterized protein YjiS (DUF1127 family)
MIGIWSDAIMTATLVAPGAAPRPAAATGGLRGLARWWRARRRLAELDALDDRMLADIGLRREQLTPDLVLRAEDGAEARRAAPAGRPAPAR